MKSRRLRIAAAAAILVLIAPAFAQTAVKATIPFDFTIEKQTMSAGEYKVAVLNTVLQLVRLDGPGSCFVQSYVASYEKDVVPRLVFHRYGTRSFLSQAWVADTGHELFTSAREIEYARTEKQDKVIVLASMFHNP